MADKFTLARLFPLLKTAGNEWLEDKAMKMSAALAYYTAVSIAPLLIITIKLVSIFYRRHAGDLIRSQLQQLTDPAVAQALSDAINKAGSAGAGRMATLISIIIALLGASGVFGELQDSLNTIWEVRPKPDRGIMGIIEDRFLSITMVFGIAFLLLVSMFVSTVVHGISSSTVHLLIGGNGRVGEYVLDGVNLALSLVVVTVLFAAIFRFLPDVEIAWADVWLGALVTSVLFEIGKLGLSEYFVHGSPTSAYGAAGSMVAVLLWVCYSAYILFFGAEFTQVYANEYGSHIVPSRNAEPLTEEMRARAGIPHGTGPVDASAPQGAHPGAAPAGAAVRPVGDRFAARARFAPRRLVVAQRRRRRSRPTHRPALADRRSYVARYLPFVAGVVIAHFAWGQYRRAHAGRAVAPLPWWRRGRGLGKLARAMRAGPMIGRALGAARALLAARRQWKKMVRGMR